MPYTTTMSIMTLDTLQWMKKFKGGGFSEPQSEALVYVIKEAFEAEAADVVRQRDLSQVVQHTDLKTELANFATKSDLRELELRMTIKLGAMMFAVSGVMAGVIIAAVKYMIAHP